MHGLVIGRFQPVHKGHVELIRRAIEDCVSVTVVVGSSDAKINLRNPFSFEERKEMLESVFGDSIEILGVPDLHNPPAYANHVLDQTGLVDHVFGNDNSTLDLFEDAGCDVIRPGLSKREEWEGKTIRAWLAEGDALWRKAVPPTVVEILERIEASKRLARME